MQLANKKQGQNILNVSARAKYIRPNGGRFEPAAAGFAGEPALVEQHDVVAGGGLFAFEDR